MRDYFATITIEEADRICREAMVPGGPCNTVRELVHDEQVANREMLLHVADSRLGDTLQVGKPAKFLRDCEGDNEINSAPALGADTNAVLQQLALAPEQIRALQADGIV